MVDLIHGVHHYLLGRHAEPNHERHVSIVGIKPIMPRPKDPSGRHLNTFMPSATDLEVALILFVEGDRLLVEKAGEEDRFVRSH